MTVSELMGHLSRIDGNVLVAVHVNKLQQYHLVKSASFGGTYWDGVYDDATKSELDNAPKGFDGHNPEIILLECN